MSHPLQAGFSARKDGLDLAALAGFLRRRHPHCTAGYVAAATDIPEATVKDWLQLRCRPSARHLITLIAAAPYGLALLEACWPDAPSAIRHAAQAQTLEALRAEQAHLARRIAAIEGRAP